MTDQQPLPEPEQKIELDANGDPIRQGSLMNERQSYERVIEGLKMASDAAVHLVAHEPLNASLWRGLAAKLDQVRRACVQQAGIEDPIRQKKTEEIRHNPMAWRKARDRFRDGLVQTAGGMRQLATCHRCDFRWTALALQVEQLEQNVFKPKTTDATTIRKIDAAVRRSGLILPEGYH
jgi:hypothetical protein